jgi:adenosine deaminase
MGFQLMQTEEALELVTEDVFRQLVDDGVIYAEIRFAPLLHNERGMRPERVVSVVERTVDRLSNATDTQAGVILCTLRHFTEAQSMLTARLVKEFHGSRVVALDIAGDEAGFPLDSHIAAYRYAREQGLFRTAHAGEALGPESVWETFACSSLNASVTERAASKIHNSSSSSGASEFTWNCAPQPMSRSSPPLAAWRNIRLTGCIAPASRST